MDGIDGGAAVHLHLQERFTRQYFARELRIVRAIGDHRLNALAHGVEIIIVPHYENRSIMCAKVIIEFTFSFAYTFHAAKSFQVGLAAVGDESVRGIGVHAVSGNFFLVVGAHFNHSDLRSLGNREDGQRYADVVVEVANGGGCFVGSTQYRAHQFFGGGFSIAARDGQEWNIELGSMVARQILECF